MTRRRASVPLTVYVVNADNGRGAATVDELRALDESEHRTGGADIIGILEATGNVLPHLPTMACEVGASTRGRGGRRAHGESRGNVAVYVRRTLLTGNKIRGRWHDRVRTWPRTKYPEKGAHPARSDFEVTNLGRVQTLLAHVPPVAEGTGPAREESIDGIVHTLAPWTRPGWSLLRRGQKWARRNRPRLCLIDHNHAGAEIARRTGMTLVGGKVDALLVGGDVIVGGHRYVDAFPLPATPGARPRPPVHFRGDHGDVLRVVVRIPSKYLPAPYRLSEVPS